MGQGKKHNGLGKESISSRMVKAQTETRKARRDKSRRGGKGRGKKNLP